MSASVWVDEQPGRGHHVMGCSSAVSRKQLLTQATTRVNLRMSVLCGGGQMWKDPESPGLLADGEVVSVWMIHR